MAWLPLLMTLIPLAMAEDGDGASPRAVPADGAEQSPPEPVPVPEPTPRSARTEPVPIVLDLDVTFPSALERLEPSADAIARESAPELEALTEQLPDLEGLVDGGGMLRGRFGLRPRLAWTGRLDGPGSGMRAGLLVKHQWWSLLPLGPQWVGETTIGGSLAFAGARGRAASLRSVAGAWLGPVSLGLGPRLAWDSVDFGAGSPLDPGLVAGPMALLGTELGPLGLQLGGGPSWLVAGSREPATLPFGDEWLGLAALGLDTGLLRWTLNGQVRETPVGTLMDLSLGLNLALD